jgi:hypothetical protein
MNKNPRPRSVGDEVARIRKAMAAPVSPASPGLTKAALRRAIADLLSKGLYSQTVQRATNEAYRVGLSADDIQHRAVRVIVPPRLWSRRAQIPKDASIRRSRLIEEQNGAVQLAEAHYRVTIPGNRAWGDFCTLIYVF